MTHREAMDTIVHTETDMGTAMATVTEMTTNATAISAAGIDAIVVAAVGTMTTDHAQRQDHLRILPRRLHHHEKK